MCVCVGRGAGPAEATSYKARQALLDLKGNLWEEVKGWASMASPRPPVLKWLENIYPTYKPQADSAPFSASRPESGEQKWASLPISCLRQVPHLASWLGRSWVFICAGRVGGGGLVTVQAEHPKKHSHFQTPSPNDSREAHF